MFGPTSTAFRVSNVPNIKTFIVIHRYWKCWCSFFADLSIC